MEFVFRPFLICHEFRVDNSTILLHKNHGLDSEQAWLCHSNHEDLNYLRTGKIEWPEIFWSISLAKSVAPNFFLSRGPVWPVQRAKKPTFSPDISFVIKMFPHQNKYQAV